MEGIRPSMSGSAILQRMILSRGNFDRYLQFR
jgi:hypothetical protein